MQHERKRNFDENCRDYPLGNSFGGKRKSQVRYHQNGAFQR